MANTKQKDWLAGKLFLRPQPAPGSAARLATVPQGFSWQQGRIVGRVEGDYYLIELFSWIDGKLTHMTIASVGSMVDWKLYDHNDGHGAWREESRRLYAQGAEAP